MWNNHKLISNRKNEAINQTFSYSYDVQPFAILWLFDLADYYIFWNIKV